MKSRALTKRGNCKCYTKNGEITWPLTRAYVSQHTSHRPVSSCDLKQKRSNFRRRVSTFLQLVVALDCFIYNKLKIRITLCILFIKRVLKCFLNCCCTRGLLQESLLCQFVNIVVTVTVLFVFDGSDPFLCTDNTNLLLSRRFYGFRNSSLPPLMYEMVNATQRLPDALWILLISPSRKSLLWYLACK